eukprot:693399-Alexandrium_andersonii.AAC.1
MGGSARAIDSPSKHRRGPRRIARVGGMLEPALRLLEGPAFTPVPSAFPSARIRVRRLIAKCVRCARLTATLRAQSSRRPRPSGHLGRPVSYTHLRAHETSAHL